MKIAIYLRVSTEEQSYDSQSHEINQLLDARKWSVLKQYQEKESGAKADRLALQKLLEDAKRGMFDTLIIYKLDRLGRSLKQVISTLDDLAHYGVKVISIKENLDFTTPTGRLMIHLISSFSEFERELIAERVRSGLRAAKAKGKTLGRPRKVNLKVIKGLRLEGLSIRAIAKRLSLSKSAIQVGLKA